MRKQVNCWYVLQIINAGTFITTLDAGIVNVALPTMSHQFSVSLAQIQWVVTSYLLTMVALLPLLGQISDRLDRRKIYSIGFLIFSMGSLTAVLSTSLTAIVASRCLQGIGAAMIMANSQAMVRAIFPDHERGKALGINAIVISIGTLSGPAFGGAILEYMNWPVLFIINVPIGIAAMICGLYWFPATEQRTSKQFDFIGSFVMAVGVSMLLLAVTDSQAEGYTKTIDMEIIIGLILIVGLIFYERRIKHAIMDRELFSNRTIVLGNSSSFLINICQMATTIPVIFYMQEVMGYSTGKIGIFLAIQPLLMGITAPLAGWYRDRYGAFTPLLLGPLACVLSMVYIAFTGHASTLGIAIYLALYGIGMGLFHATNNTEIMTAAPSTKISLTSSMLALIRYLGMIIGTGLAAYLVGEAGSSSANQTIFLYNIQVLFMISFVLCLLTVVLAMMRNAAKQR